MNRLIALILVIVLLFSGGCAVDITWGDALINAESKPTGIWKVEVDTAKNHFAAMFDPISGVFMLGKLFVKKTPTGGGESTEQPGGVG